MFFFQLNFNYTSITSYKKVVQDISTFFATVRGFLASKVMFTFYREALISFVSVTTEICWNAPTMGFWYLAQNISANVFWCFWQLFALEICGLDARMSTGCHSKITVSPKIEPTPHAKARDQARVKHRRARNTMVCSRRLAPAHLQAWQVEILSFGCNPDLARGTTMVSSFFRRTFLFGKITNGSWWTTFLFEIGNFYDLAGIPIVKQ